MGTKIPILLIILIAGGMAFLYFTGIFASTATVRDEPMVKDDEILATVMKIKNDLKIGMTKNDVIEVFGQNYILVDDNGDLENGLDEHWKYPFFQEKEYHPSVPDYVVDEEGLRSRKIGVSLFIGWKNEQVSLYSITYVMGQNNEIYMYVNQNGTTEEVILNPDGSHKQIGS